MDNMLQDFYSCLAEAEDRSSVWERLLEFAHALGIDCVHTWFGTTPDDMEVLTTCPDWWTPYYMENEFWRGDMVWKHCHSGHGITTYGLDSHGRNPAMPEETMELANIAREAIDLGSGIGFPLFLPDGQRMGGINLGFQGPLEHLAKVPRQQLMTAIMAATAAHAKSYALNSMGLDCVHLTSRERECLLWLSKGRRTKEISDKLNLSDYTVNFHLSNAKAKLGAETREQAVARAVVLGLITP